MLGMSRKHVLGGVGEGGNELGGGGESGKGLGGGGSGGGGLGGGGLGGGGVGGLGACLARTHMRHPTGVSLKVACFSH